MLKPSLLVLLALCPLLVCCSEDKGETSQSNASASEKTLPAQGDAKEASPSGSSQPPAKDYPVKAIEAWRRDLLEQAFAAVSKIPDNPHKKTRCQLQAEVAKTAIDLGQYDIARRFAREIDNWERGVALGQLALALVREGGYREVQDLLRMADSASRDTLKDINPQDWQIDRIRALIASTHTALGNPTEAARWSNGLVPSEARSFAIQRAEDLDEEGLNALLTEIDSAFANTDMEKGLAALGQSLVGYRRAAGNPTLMASFAARVQTTTKAVPAPEVFKALCELAEMASKQQDAETFDACVQKTEAMANTIAELDLEWELRGRLAAALAKAGREARARDILTSLRSRTEVEREKIPDVFRAELWRSLATGWMALGDLTHAMEAVSGALEDGARNPNSWPRSEDLSQTLQLMARLAIPPTEDQSARIATLAANLGPPW